MAENSKDEKIVRWNKYHIIFLIILSVSSLALNIAGNDLGSPGYSGWLPFSIQIADYIKYDGNIVSTEYSSAGFLHYVPFCNAALFVNKIRIEMLYMILVDEAVWESWLNNAMLFPVVRYVNAFFGALLVFLFVMLLRKIVEPAMLFPMAMLMALDQSLIYWSHTESINTLILFWGMLSVVFFARYLKSGRLASLALAAAAACIAAAVKETFWGVGPFFIAAGPLIKNGFTKTVIIPKNLARYAATVAAGAVLCVGVVGIFYLTNPQHNNAHLQRYFQGENENMATASTQTGAGAPKSVSEITGSFFKNIISAFREVRNRQGFFVFLLILAGIVLGIRYGNQSPLALALIAGAGGYLITYLSWFPMFWRRIQPYDLDYLVLCLTPLLVIPIVHLAKSKKLWIGKGALILGAAIIAWFGFVAMVTVYSFQSDPREKAEDYIAGNKEPVSVHVIEYTGFKMFMQRYPRIIRTENFFPTTTGFSSVDSDYMILDQEQSARYSDFIEEQAPPVRYKLEEVFKPSALVRKHTTIGQKSVWLYRRIGQGKVPAPPPEPSEG